MKKKIIIIIAAVLAFALIITGSILLITKNFFDASAKGPVMKVGSVEGEVGEVVNVPVSIKGNPGFMSFLVQFTYNPELIEYINYKEGNLLEDHSVNATAGEIRFLALENNNVYKNGDLIYFRFKILKEIPNGAEITLNIPKNNVVNYDEQSVPFIAENGIIKTK